MQAFKNGLHHMQCHFLHVNNTHFSMIKYPSLLSARTTMWSMPVVLTETENEYDSANQNDVAKMML